MGLAGYPSIKYDDWKLVQLFDYRIIYYIYGGRYPAFRRWTERTPHTASAIEVTSRIDPKLALLWCSHGVDRELDDHQWETPSRVVCLRSTSEQSGDFPTAALHCGQLVSGEFGPWGIVRGRCLLEARSFGWSRRSHVALRKLVGPMPERRQQGGRKGRPQ